MTSDAGNSQLYLNLGDGLFRNVTATNGTGADRSGMRAAIADYDNDGDLDWFVSSIAINSSQFGNRLYRNRGDGAFRDVTELAGVNVGYWGWGSSFGDLDIDMDLDLFNVNGWWDGGFDHRPAVLFEQSQWGEFLDVAENAGADHRGDGRGVILADFDNDGDLDIGHL